MKQNTPANVNMRIERFMKQKIAEYPELAKKYGPKVTEVQRGYFLEDFIGLFRGKRAY